MTKGFTTKNQIIATATELFYKKGVANVTFQMIATELGLTQPSLYRYFADRQDVMLACCLYSAEEGRQFIDRQIDERAGADARLKSYISGNMKWALTKHAQIHTLLGMYYFSLNDPKLKAVFKQINETGIGRIETHLILGNHEKTWKVKNPRKSAQAIHSYLSGEMIKACHWPRELGSDERLKQVWDFIRGSLA